MVSVSFVDKAIGQAGGGCAEGIKSLHERFEILLTVSDILKVAV